MAKKHKILILAGAVVIVAIFFFGFVCGTFLREKNRITITGGEQNSIAPLDLADCDRDGAKVQYLNFAEASTEKTEERERDSFLITCNPEGSGAYTDAYVFKGNKLVFRRVGIYHGKAFFAEDNILNVYKGILDEGDANCCPSLYELKRYKYDIESNTMKLIETKNYTAQEFERLNIE